MSELKIKESIEEIWVLIKKANRYVDQTSPWSLKNDNPGYLNTVLYIIAELWGLISIFIEPFLPQASQEIQRRLGLSESKLSMGDVLKSGKIQPGLQIKSGLPLFPRRK